MKINRIKIILLTFSLSLSNLLWGQDEAIVSKEKLAKVWLAESQSIYDLLVAQLKNSESDYEGSVDTLIKYAKKQKDEELLSKAFISLLQTERYADALELVDFWKVQTAKDLSKFHVLAQVLNSHFDLALETLKKRLDKLPNDETRKFLLDDYIKMLLTYWYRSEVVDFLVRIYNDYPDDERLGLIVARQLRWQGEIEKANKIFIKLKFNNPKSFSLLQEQSDMFRYSGLVERANYLWLDALKDYPKEEQVRFAYAYFLFSQCEYQQSLQQLQKINTNDTKLLSSIATLKMMATVQLGDGKKAAEAFDWEHLSFEEKNLAHFNYGIELLNKKQFNLSFRQFDKIDKDSELALSARLKKAQIRYRDSLSSGDEYFEQIIKEYQLDKVSAVREQAGLLKAVSRDEVAYERLSDYLKDSPGNEEVRYSRALLAAELNLNSQAVEDLSIIYAKSPENTDIQNALGYTLLADSNNPKMIKKAIKLIKKSLFLQPTNPAVVDSMGWALYRQNKPEEALPFLRYAYGNYQEAEVAGHLITVLFAVGEIQQAKALYQLEIKRPDNIEKIRRYTKAIDKEIN